MNLLSSEVLPNLLYLALVVGVWFAAAAVVTPGTGALEVLAFAALAVVGVGTLYVPVNLWAVFVLVLAAVFFVLSFLGRRGARWLAAAGVTASVGSAFLFRVPGALLSVHPVLAVLGSALILGFFWLAVHPAIQAYRRVPSVNPGAVVGETGEVRTAVDPVGSVFVGGELWTARVGEGAAASPLQPGARVRVTGREGLTLFVEPVGPEPDGAA